MKRKKNIYVQYNFSPPWINSVLLVESKDKLADTEGRPTVH
jgi:hypothetical protein